MKRRLATAAAVCSICLPAMAGQAQRWEDLPEAVRKTVLANGGKAGMSVDKEGERRDGLDVYEAGVKGKDGNVADLVVTADGKVVETKTDDASDAAAERTERAKRLLQGVKFSHPREITNAYLPLSELKQDVLEGTEDGNKTRVERTAKPDVRRTFDVGGNQVEAFVVEDRAYENGHLAEVAIDYFAQDDAGTVWYLGEDVDEYKDGKVSGHDGTWGVGKETPAPGVMFPAEPKLGAKWRSEDVSASVGETDEITSLTETVATESGKYENCVKVKESLADGTTEYKFYAKSVGVVREVPADGDELLKTHSKK